MNAMPLTDDQIRQIAPSVFATHAGAGVSERYAYIPSYPVLRQMRLLGLEPVKVRQSVKRAPDGTEFAMHEIRFRNTDSDAYLNETRHLGQLTPEVLLRNSHDRTSPLSFSAGIHRLVCLNGMTVMEQGSQFTIRHVGRDKANQVADAISAITGNFRKTIEIAEAWSKIEMSPELQRRFAKAALDVRGTSLEISDEDVRQILRPRRTFDTGINLWSVFNRAQENLTRGVYVDTRNESGFYMGRRKLKGITTLTKDVDLNRKLWALASGFAEEQTKARAVVGAA